jgi:hypothetical protein
VTRWRAEADALDEQNHYHARMAIRRCANQLLAELERVP